MVSGVAAERRDAAAQVVLERGDLFGFEAAEHPREDRGPDLPRALELLEPGIGQRSSYRRGG